MKLQAETYYELLSRFIILERDAALSVRLRRGDVVLCDDIVRRSGEHGRGKYARLLYRKDGETLVIFHRLSSFNRGAGQWEELNPMVALARIKDLPVP